MNHITRDLYGLWLLVSPTIRQWAIIYSSKTGNQLIKSKSVQKKGKRHLARIWNISRSLIKSLVFHDNYLEWVINECGLIPEAIMAKWQQYRHLFGKRNCSFMVLLWLFVALNELNRSHKGILLWNFKYQYICFYFKSESEKVWIIHSANIHRAD